MVWNYADTVCDLALLACPGHTATSTGGPGGFNSPTLHTPGAVSGNSPTSYALSFSSPGTYTYTCSFHGGSIQHMDGAIVVQAAAPQGAGGGGGGGAPAGPTHYYGPGTAAAGSPGGVPFGSSDSVPADQLPDTFLPGLPASGRVGPIPVPTWALPALVAALLTLPAAFAINRFTIRGR